MAYDAEFDLVTMTGHAVQELRTDDDVRSVLRGIRDAVRPGRPGRLQTRTRPPRWEAWPGHVHEVTYQDTPIKVWYELDAVEGDLVTFTEFTDGGRWHRQADRGTLRFLSRIDLDRFLAEAGLQVETYYGDWDEGPVTEDSPEIIAIARRSAL